MSDNPKQPDTANQPPHPRREITTTKSWNGTRNRHQTHASISAYQQGIRDRHLAFIMEHWQTTDPDDFFPAALRPNGLPTAPKDYCTEMLEAFAALARLTRGKLPRALRSLRQAPADRGGWRGARVGVEDVWRACVLVEIDEKGAKASKEQAGKVQGGGSSSETAVSDDSTNEAPMHRQADEARTSPAEKPADADVRNTAAYDTALEGSIRTLQALTIADNEEVHTEKSTATPRKTPLAVLMRSFSICAAFLRFLGWVLVIVVMGVFVLLFVAVVCSVLRQQYLEMIDGSLSLVRRL